MNRQETEHWIRKIPPCTMELEGQDIVFLSHQRWDDHFTPVHGTTLRLAQRNRVLFMEPPDSFGWLFRMFKDTDHRHPGARKALKYTFNRFESYNDSFAVYHTPPLFLPGQAKSKSILSTMNLGYRWMIQDGIHQMNLVDPIYWVYMLNMVGVIDAINPRLTVYECTEEGAAFTTREHIRRYVEEMDVRICRRADVVIVPNPNMYDARKDLCADIQMLPWAADVEHYSRAMNPDLPIPEDIASIPHPIIGMYANIDRIRFDVDLLVRLARRHPKWNIVLVGRVLPDFDTTPFDRTPNIHLIPKRPLEQLPAYVKAFDVCIVPYLLNGFTRSITPLKYTEYLATGKPVVTTNLPATILYPGVLRIADNIDEFEAHIRDALANPDEGRQERQRVALDNNWDGYMRRKTAAVNAHLDQKTAAEPDRRRCDIESCFTRPDNPKAPHTD